MVLRGLEPIKFEFSSFTTVIFPHKALTAERFISENKSCRVNFGIKSITRKLYLFWLEYL